MLPVRDMDRMVAFSGDGVGLTVVFYSPLWTRWQRSDDRVACRWHR